MAQEAGNIPAELPSTFTHTLIPISADAVETLVSILVSVKRPVTSEGLTSNVVPFPFPVEMFAEVAKIARPRKRRQISEEQRQAAKARFQASREQRKALAIPG